ncbi:hypothetical protein B0H14DRAFT_244820 [Mycena olivaceomarginata]|nr:hypothetical protein B0H14DRAFT_244820 [Mycena olivaceomarginata]
MVGGLYMVSLVGSCIQSHPLALNSDLTPVSARHLSRWLFLLVHHSAGATPIRPPAVYHPMTVMGADIFVHCLDETETFPYDSPNPLPPGCYVLFDLNNNPYPYLVGRTMPRPTSTKTQPTWNVLDDDSRASYRMTVTLSRSLSPARLASATAGCAVSLAAPQTASPGSFPHFFLGLLPRSPFHSSVASPRTMSSQSHPTSSRRTTTTVSPSTHRYKCCCMPPGSSRNLTPQDGYRIVLFEDFLHVPLLNCLGSLPSSGHFWHASLC